MKCSASPIHRLVFFMFPPPISSRLLYVPVFASSFSLFVVAPQPARGVHWVGRPGKWVEGMVGLFEDWSFLYPCCSYRRCILIRVWRSFSYSSLYPTLFSLYCAEEGWRETERIGRRRRRRRRDRKRRETQAARD